MNLLTTICGFGDVPDGSETLDSSFVDPHVLTFLCLRVFLVHVDVVVANLRMKQSPYLFDILC